MAKRLLILAAGFTALALECAWLASTYRYGIETFLFAAASALWIGGVTAQFAGPFIGSTAASLSGAIAPLVLWHWLYDQTAMVNRHQTSLVLIGLIVGGTTWIVVCGASKVFVGHRAGSHDGNAATPHSHSTGLALTRVLMTGQCVAVLLFGISMLKLGVNSVFEAIALAIFHSVMAGIVSLLIALPYDVLRVLDEKTQR